MADTIDDLTAREKQLLIFLRELGWGEVKIRLKNGQPVLICEAIRTLRLEDDEQQKDKKSKNKNAPPGKGDNLCPNKIIRS